MEEEKHFSIKNQKMLIANIALVCVLLFLLVLYIFSNINFKRIESNLNLKNEQISSLNNSITKLRKENNEYSERISKYEKQISFMDKHVAICVLDGSGLYHRYGCKQFDWNKSFSFFIYNDRQASNEGFSPCHYCSSLDNTKDEKTEIVYITTTGSMYHRENCSYLKSKNAITREEAIKQGYSACSRCKP